MKIIILIALRGVKFPEGGAAAPVAPPPLDTPLVYDYFINIKYIANTFTRKNNLSRQDYSLIPYSFHIKPQLATATIGAIRWPTYSCLG